MRFLDIRAFFAFILTGAVIGSVFWYAGAARDQVPQTPKNAASQVALPASSTEPDVQDHKAPSVWQAQHEDPLVYISQDMDGVLWSKGLHHQLAFLDQPKIWEQNPGFQAVKKAVGRIFKQLDAGEWAETILNEWLTRREGLLSIPGLRDLLGTCSAFAIKLHEGGLQNAKWLAVCQVPDHLQGNLQSLLIHPQDTETAILRFGPLAITAFYDAPILILANKPDTILNALKTSQNGPSMRQDSFFQQYAFQGEHMHGGVYFDYRAVYEHFPLLEALQARKTVPGNVAANVLKPIQSLIRSGHVFQVADAVVTITGKFEVSPERLENRLKSYYRIAPSPFEIPKTLPKSVICYRPWRVGFSDFWEALLEDQTPKIRQAMKEEVQSFEAFLGGVTFESFLASIGPEVGVVLATQPEVINDQKALYPLPAIAFLFQLEDPDTFQTGILKSVCRGMNDMLAEAEAKKQPLPFKLVEEPLGQTILYRIPIDADANYLGSGLDPAFYFTDNVLVVSSSASFVREFYDVAVGKAEGLVASPLYQCVTGSADAPASTGLYVDVPQAIRLIGDLGSIVIDTNDTMTEQERAERLEDFTCWLEIARLMDAFGSSTIRSPDTYLSKQVIRFRQP